MVAHSHFDSLFRQDENQESKQPKEEPITMSMKRERQDCSSDFRGEDEHTSSDDKETTDEDIKNESIMSDSFPLLEEGMRDYLGDYGEKFGFNQESYHDDAFSAFPPSHKGQTQAATCAYSFAENANDTNSGRSRSNQSTYQLMPDAFVLPKDQNTDKDKETRQDVVGTPPKKRKYENAQINHAVGHRVVPSDSQSLESRNTPTSHEHGLGSLNRLIDRFILSAERGAPSQDDRLLNHCCFPFTETQHSQEQSSLRQDPPGLLAQSPSAGLKRQAHSYGPADKQHFQDVNILQQPFSDAFHSFQESHRPSADVVDRSPSLTNGWIPSEGFSSSASLYSPRNMYLRRDPECLSPYQCLLRQQLDFFAADWDDIAVIQGRTNPVVRHQVGIRCIHCAHIPLMTRDSGSMYFSARLEGIYQSAQNLAKMHLLEKCWHVPAGVRQQLLELKRMASASSTRLCSNNLLSGGSGKRYWAEAALEVGVFEDEANEKLEFR